MRRTRAKTPGELTRRRAAAQTPLVSRRRSQHRADDIRGYVLAGSDQPWRDWLGERFPETTSAPFAPRHENLWEWFDALTPGVKPRPRVEVWPRGGAKSSSGELGCTRVGAKLTRRFVLYVCETQDQADKHVQAVAEHFESLGVGRAVNPFGSSKGWRKNQIRTANGFNVAGIGMDTATRGIRLGKFRPDLIIFDDIDGRLDTAATIKKKIAIITQSLLPAGSSDCAVLFLQNLIHASSIVSKLVDGTADFLHNREVPCVEPAVIGLKYVAEPQEDGSLYYRITAGVPTWEGQNLATCEAQINEWGVNAFLREAQQMVADGGGVFHAERIRVVGANELPALKKIVRAWDLAATAGGGNWTVGVKMALGADKCIYILDVVRGQWDTNKRDGTIRATAEDDGRNVRVRGPQDPGAAGVSVAVALTQLLQGYTVTFKPVSGSKETRADPFSSQVNASNVFMVRASWNSDFRRELQLFPAGDDDDQVDAAADAYSELCLTPPPELNSIPASQRFASSSNHPR